MREMNRPLFHFSMDGSFIEELDGHIDSKSTYISFSVGCVDGD